MSSTARFEHLATKTVDDLDLYLMTDEPTACPRCHRRTSFEDLGGGREHHTCSCGYQFLMDSPEVDGEEQCEFCREFTFLGHLDDQGICDRCLRAGVTFCAVCDDIVAPDDHAHDEG